jgi:PP-loop superfamily ATP-utilizing enzyme
VEEILHNRKSRFDIALFYTGGKDSSYMLYYLSKVKGLRVLALTWEIPYMSESAASSIENAKKAFQNVECPTHTVNHNDLRKI